MEEIKNDADHYLYEILKKYPNPEIGDEGYRGLYNLEKVYSRYLKDCYKMLNKNFFT